LPSKLETAMEKSLSMMFFEEKKYKNKLLVLFDFNYDPDIFPWCLNIYRKNKDKMQFNDFLQK
jgi:hypothetical protein